MRLIYFDWQFDRCKFIFYHLTTIHFPLFFLGYLLLAIIRISNIFSFFFDKDCVQATRFSPLAQITDLCFKISNCQIQFTKYEKKIVQVIVDY